jgi:3-hydroxyisobutyrate dehydrogenase-like beta-hydroxyacid dehydrogenase
MSAFTIAIVSPGNMGAAIGARLVRHGFRVISPIGRSAASETRARNAGIELVPEAALADANYIFSIIPPKEAVATAERIAGLVASARPKPVYIDWNAVSPDTVRKIAAILDAAGARFVDGGIIGGPPASEGPGPMLYASGPHASSIEKLDDCGIRFKIMDEPIGAASALKMSYAGITKGLTALAAAMMLAAKRAGCEEALIAELSASQPQLLASFRRSVPDMFSKAERWAPELREIAHFIGASRVESGIYDSIADFYEHLAADFNHGKTEISVLAALMK